jgi:hypothetical protein
VCIPNKFDEPTFTADLPVLFRPEIVAERKMWLQQAFAQFQEEKVPLYNLIWIHSTPELYLSTDCLDLNKVAVFLLT